MQFGPGTLIWGGAVRASSLCTLFATVASPRGEVSITLPEFGLGSAKILGALLLLLALCSGLLVTVQQKAYDSVCCNIFSWEGCCAHIF